MGQQLPLSVSPGERRLPAKTGHQDLTQVSTKRRQDPLQAFDPRRLDLL